MSDLVVRRVRVFEFVVRKPRQELIQFPLWKGFYLLRDVFLHAGCHNASIMQSDASSSNRVQARA